MTALNEPGPAKFLGTAENNMRQHERIPAKDLCEIKTDPNKPSIGCLVHNISQGGALLEVSVRFVPERFLLINHHRKTKVICNIVWRCEHLLGVEFKSPQRPIYE